MSNVEITTKPIDIIRAKNIPDKFKEELETLLNRHSIENMSNTPDFVLADYLCNCLKVFTRTSVWRESCYGHYHAAGQEPIEAGSRDSLNFALDARGKES